jgi:hypothetical protein
MFIKGRIFVRLIVLSLISSIVLLDSCLSVKPSATKSGKNYFESFYTGESGTQYFIKPLVFIAKNSNDKLFIDFTFRYKNEIKDSVIVNFSIVSASMYRSIDSLIISNKNTYIESNSVDLLFNEKKKTTFLSRFTTRFSLKETNELFQNSEWIITLKNQNQKTPFRPSGKSNNAIVTLKNKLFVLM